MNSTPYINNQETKLLDNILRFIRLLRKSGVKVGNRSSIDTLKSIKILKIGNRKEFYWALFSNLINRNEDKEVFDQCFYLFWQNPKIMEQMFNLLLPQIGNQKAPENKKEKCLEFIDFSNSETCAAVKKNISETTKKIAEVKNSILDKSKIEDLAKKAGLVRR